MQKVIRHCPQCQTDRDAIELFCENEIDGKSCGWDLSAEPLVQPRSNAPSEEAISEGILAERQEETQAREGTNLCANGHSMPEGDILCITCGATAGPNNEDSDNSVNATIEEWTLIRELPKHSGQLDSFLAEQAESHDDKRYVVTIFEEGVEPDESAYGQLERLRSPRITTLIEHGRSNNRYFQIWHEAAEKSLQDIIDAGSFEEIDIRSLVAHVGQTIHELSEAGIRHRDIRPCNILLTENPSAPFQIKGFSSAIVSQLDLTEIVCPPDTTRYTAPESIIGGISAASDWWSFGMTLLELASHGAVFEGVNEKAFLIHVVTRGMEVPESVTAEITTLLSGLLVRDTSARWQWNQIQRWLRNEIPSSFGQMTSDAQSTTGQSIKLGDQEFYTPESFALAAAEAQHWNEALELFLRGAVTTWLSEINLAEVIVATVRSVCLDNSLSDDLKVAFSLLALNKSLPLSIRGEIINPKWLLTNPDKGYELITGSRIERLRQLGREQLLISLSERAANVRKRIEILDIDVDETRLRESLLSTSRRHLENAWSRLRSLFPDSRHSGIEGLLQRRSLSEEDYIILLSAPSEQFTPAADILQQAEESAKKCQYKNFDRKRVESFLTMPRSGLYEALDEVLDGFARCGIEHLDRWADTYRMERRIRLERALVLLSVAKEQWTKPEKQDYINNILGFFEKKILTKINKGPLVKQTISRTSAAIDLIEIGSARRTTQQFLEHLLERSERSVEIDSPVLEENPQLASRISSLIKKTRIFTRDTGRHGLFLGFPYLIYQTTTFDGEIRYRAAPLMLWPIRVEANSMGRGRIKLASEVQREEMRLNPALEGIIGFESGQIERWRRCAEEIVQRSSVRYRDVLDIFAQVAAVPNKEIVRLPDKDSNHGQLNRYIASSAVLFNCDFSGKSIADDLHHMKKRPLTDTALERFLRMAGDIKPSAKTAGTDNYSIMALDPSQTEAIRRANGDAGLHVEGPPGTGKSQTIVNMIADTIAQGQTVLVVCQKLAALNIVEKRLKAHGLENRLFLINDIQKDRSSIIKAFRDQLEKRHSYRGNLRYWRNEQLKTLSKIGMLEGEINQQHKTLHAIDDKVGVSYRSILSELIGLESAGNYLSVPAVRKLLAKEDLSDADVSQIADVVTGIVKLWLDSNFEESALRPLKAFSWDKHAEDSLADAIAEHIESEKRRADALKSHGASPDLADVGSVSAWIDKYSNELVTLDEDAWKNVHRWMSIFPGDNGRREGQGYSALHSLQILIESIEALGKAGHTDPLSSVLTEQSIEVLSQWLDKSECSVEEENSPTRRRSRWAIARFLQSKHISLSLPGSADLILSAFARFMEEETQRNLVLNETTPCFDTTDGETLSEWLKDNVDYFLRLDPVQRINLSKWCDLFSSPEGALILHDLASSLAKLQALDNSHHHDQLFDFFLNQPKHVLSNTCEIAKKASMPISPFKSEKEEQLRARWTIVKLLSNAGITDLQQISGSCLPTLRAALEKFVQAEEERTKCIREHREAFIIDDAEALQKWVESNGSMLANLSDRVRGHLADLLKEAAPDTKRLLIVDKLIADLEAIRKSIDSLNREHHNERFFGHILDMPPSAVVEWIATSKKALDGFVLNPGTHIARWKQGQLLRRIGGERNRNVYVQFLNACQLEYELVPIRSGIKSILKQLNMPVSDTGALTLDQLSHRLASLLEHLQQLQAAGVAVFACPAHSQARDFVVAGTKEAYDHFARKCHSAIELWRVRNVSHEALKGLNNWFDERWILSSKDYVDSLHHNLAEVKLIWDGLTLFNDGTMILFENAVTLEAAVSPIRTVLVTCLMKLNESAEKASKGTLSELIDLSSSLLQKTKITAEANSRLQSCPCNRRDLKFIDDPGAEALATFVSQSKNAIRRCNARANSSRALGPLADWFEDDWIKKARENIDGNAMDLESLQKVAPILPLLDDTTFETFFKACKLEVGLKQLRLSYNQTAKVLSLEPVDDVINVFDLETLCHKTASDLEFGCAVIEKINACPQHAEAREFCKKDTKAGFAKLSTYLAGIIERFKTRKRSSETLSSLEEWFNETWIKEQEVAICKNIVNTEQLECVKEAVPTLAAFQQFRQRAQTLDKRCLEILSACQKHRKTFLAIHPAKLRDAMRSTIRRESCLNWKTDMDAAHPELLLEGDEVMQKLHELSAATETLTDLNKKLLIEPEWKEEHISLADNEWEAITRLRGQRMVRLREFVEKGSELGLLKIRPIWLMNPEAASRLLPLQSGFFDKVIFDEASQLLVEYALPALYRAKQAVVSGDEKQMPPSDFFGSKVGDDDDTEFDEDDDNRTEEERLELEERWNRKEIKDCPDLLTLASSVLPQCPLEIHYRSEYRELIAFSNAAFYKGNLNIPSKHPADEVRRHKPIEVVRVNSVYKKQTNEGEARRVVDELKKLWKLNQRPSVGVVTFNLPQMELIEDLLGEEAERDPLFAQIRQTEDLREEDGEDMGFFVKNLENVQGDERDVIIFSTTFGPNEKGEFRKNFGRVGQGGGDRRLNVAITRAKHKVVLVTSMVIDQISDCIQKGRKPREGNGREHLHYYLEYACRVSDGNLDDANALLGKLTARASTREISFDADGFVFDVKTFVEELGYQAILGGNDEGAFSLDLAVVNPANGLFGLGIECDAPRHHLLESAYHREVWRQEVLRRSVKKVHRVSSRHWYHDKKQQKKLLQQAIEQAMA